MTSEVRTRFAPSPTGYLHIGGARTALFNYLFAKKYGGQFLLRIEDTDLARSKPEYYEPIFEGLKWLGLDHDDKVVFQSKNNDRYLEVAHELLRLGKAYKCFVKEDEILNKRLEHEAKGTKFKFKSPWRDKDSDSTDSYVIRLKTPENHQIILDDQVQGKVIISTDEIDDQILVRSNGLATYMLSVVVDDHDMKISDVIRGDDHLNNAPKQLLIYQALSWEIPNMYHIPLIHGSDGHKLSKRHGAASINDYTHDYLPVSMRNYLINLGWHSPQAFDTMTKEEAISIFDSSGFSKGPSRIDLNKLKDINRQNISRMNKGSIFAYLKNDNLIHMSPINQLNFELALDSIKTRCDVLSNIPKLAKIYSVEFEVEELKLQEFLTNNNHSTKELIQGFIDMIKSIAEQPIEKSLTDKFTNVTISTIGKALEYGISLVIDSFAPQSEPCSMLTNQLLTDYETLDNQKDIEVEKIKTLVMNFKIKIEEASKNYAKQNQIKIGELMKIVRFSLTGLENSPSIFELIAVIGPKITEDRLIKAINSIKN